MFVGHFDKQNEDPELIQPICPLLDSSVCVVVLFLLSHTVCVEFPDHLICNVFTASLHSLTRTAHSHHHLDHDKHLNLGDNKRGNTQISIRIEKNNEDQGGKQWNGLHT